MLESHGRQINTTEITSQKSIKNNPEETKQKSCPGTASNEITGGLKLDCSRPTLALRFALALQTLSCLVCVEDS